MITGRTVGAGRSSEPRPQASLPLSTGPCCSLPWSEAGDRVRAIDAHMQMCLCSLRPISQPPCPLGISCRVMLCRTVWCWAQTRAPPRALPLQTRTARRSTTSRPTSTAAALARQPTRRMCVLLASLPHLFCNSAPVRQQNTAAALSWRLMPRSFSSRSPVAAPSSMIWPTACLLPCRLCGPASGRIGAPQLAPLHPAVLATLGHDPPCPCRPCMPAGDGHGGLSAGAAPLRNWHAVARHHRHDAAEEPPVQVRRAPGLLSASGTS